MDYIAKVTAIAKNEVGYLEKKSNKNLDSKTANAGYNNYTKYGAWYGDNPDYWCAMFICWIFYKAFGKELAKKILWNTFSAACETLRQAAIKADAYTTKNPKAGYVIFFTGTRHSGANHIGYVYKVSGNTVYTIEGNTSSSSGVIDNGGAVAYKSYTISNSRIMGYGIPKYPNTNTTTATKTETTKTSYYPKYTGSSAKIDVVLKAIGVPASQYGDWKKRKVVATANGISNYTGTATQNTKLINLAKTGKLKK